MKQRPFVLSEISVCLLMMVIHCVSVQGSSSFFSLEVQNEENPLEVYPLAIGNKWIYENVYKSAIHASTNVITIKWESEILVKDHDDIPEGKVIERSVLNRNIKFEYPKHVKDEEIIWFKEMIKKNDYDHYLIKGNYVYELPNWGWDGKNKVLTENFRKRIGNGLATPSFFFPMEKVVMWSNLEREREDYEKTILFQQGKGPAPNPGMYYWVVEGTVDVEVPYGKVNNVVSLIYRTVGGPSHVWFRKGLGVIKTKYVHQGSYIESETVLKDFIPSQEN